MGSSARFLDVFQAGEQAVAVCSAGRSHPAQPAAERSSVTLPLSTTSVNLTQRQEACGRRCLPALLLLINYCFFLHGVRCGEESNHIQGQGWGVVWCGVESVVRHGSPPPSLTRCACQVVALLSLHPDPVTSF